MDLKISQFALITVPRVRASLPLAVYLMSLLTEITFQLQLTRILNHPENFTDYAQSILFTLRVAVARTAQINLPRGASRQIYYARLGSTDRIRSLCRIVRILKLDRNRRPIVRKIERYLVRSSANSIYPSKHIGNDRGNWRSPASITAFKCRMYKEQLDPRHVLRPQINIDQRKIE